MKIFKKLFGISTMLMMGFFSVAQESQKQSLTIEDAVNLANQNNITIKTSQGSLDLLKAKNTFSWNSISPSFGLSGSFVPDLEDWANPDDNIYSFGLTGSVSLTLKTNLYSDIKGAKIAYESGKLSYEQTCRKIELNVRTAFYGLLYEQENLVLQQRSLATAKTQYEQNQEKFKNGQISELDVMQSRVNYEQKIPTVESVALQLENDYSTFKQMIGIPQETLIELQGSLDDILKIKAINFPEGEAIVAPDVKTAEYNLETAKNNLLASRFSAYGPVISARFSYGGTDINMPNPEKTKNPNADVPDRIDSKSNSSSISIGVTIPLDGYLPWSTGAATIGSNKVNLNNAQMQLENTKTTVAIQTENYLRKINQGISQISSIKSTVDLANKSYTMTKTAYNYGKTDLLSLQSASDKVLTNEVNLKSQAYSLIGNILNLEYLLGLPFGTLLQEKSE